MSRLFKFMAIGVTLIACISCGEPSQEPVLTVGSPSRFRVRESTTIGNATNITIVEIDRLEYVVVHRQWAEGGVAIAPLESRMNRLESVEK